MNKKNRKYVYVFLDDEVFNSVCELARRVKKSPGITAYLLINIALKYCFRDNGTYICCEQINVLPQPSNYKRKKMHRVELSLSAKVYDKMESFSKIGYRSKSEFLRNLITTALTVAYDENLIFHQPEPIKFNYDKNKKVDTILLDII